MSDEELKLAVAKVINGPYLPVAPSSPHTLDELRDIKWDVIATHHVRAMCLVQAEAIIRYFKEVGLLKLP